MDDQYTPAMNSSASNVGIPKNARRSSPEPSAPESGREADCANMERFLRTRLRWTLLYFKVRRTNNISFNLMSRRVYRQYCGLAKALDVVGERWTMLIVRNLLLGPLRYSDLLNGLPGITTNRSEEHTSELQSLAYLVCRLLL